MAYYSDVGVRIYCKLPTEPTWERPICPTSISALGGESESLDTTTMCDSTTTSIPGRESLPNITIEGFYSGEVMVAFNKYVGVKNVSMIVSLPDGYGYFLRGEFAQWVGDIGLNSVVPRTIMFYPSYRSDLMTADEILQILPQTVDISPLPNDTVYVGSTSFMLADVVPMDATITATSSSNTVATVAVSGRQIAVTGVAAGEATITVTAAKTDYVSGITQYNVTVVANPNP